MTDHAANNLIRATASNAEPRSTPAVGNLRYADPQLGSRRVLLIGRCFVGGVTVVFLCLLARVYQLQTQPAAAVTALIDSQTSGTSMLGRRGSLLDRLGRPLATTRVGRSLYVDPGLIEDHSAFSERVAYPLNYDPAWFEQRIAERWDSRYVMIDRRLTDDRVDKLGDIRSRAVGTEQQLFRDYPQGPIAGQLMGFVNVDGLGLEGLERQFDSQLRGTTGSMRYWRDAQRRALWVDARAYHPPSDGKDLWLSIDATIQRIAEEELAAACEAYGAQAGQLIVMDPHTGEILAMANYPFMDPNAFAAAPPQVRRNRSVTDVFEPGSIFKPFVWAAAVERGYARPNETFDAGNGFHRFPTGRRLRDTRGHGVVDFEKALIVSSNIVMGMVGERMGREQLHTAVRSFGFGQSTHSRLPGEVAGLLHPVNRWTSYSTTSVPMGQEIGVTPLQITRAFCVFANDGLLVTPTILKDDPAVNDELVMVPQRILKPETARLTRHVMQRVVEEGTGRNHVRSRLYPMFGKTGTAQVADLENGGYKAGAYIGSFFGGAPVQQPRIVVGCVIHLPDPQKGYYGGTIAGPAFRKTVERTLLYLGEPPLTSPVVPPLSSR